MKLIELIKNKVTQMYLEGGNTKFELDGKIYTVSKIDFTDSKTSLKDFKTNLFKFLDKISLLFLKNYGKPLWSDNKKYFSGSSNVIFNSLEVYVKDENNKGKLLKHFNKELIKDETDLVYNWLKKFKPSAGDIDIQVSNDTKRFEVLKKILEKLAILRKVTTENELYNRLNKECKNIGDICIIENKISIGQIISACAIKKTNDKKTLSDFLFFQCDWEPVEADKNGIPTEFSQLSRNASIEDIELGIKGREHKYLLRTLANSISDSNISKIKILNPKTLNELKVDNKKGLYSFSINYGLRKKFWDPNDSKQLTSIYNYYKENSLNANLTKKQFKELYAKSNIRFQIPNDKKEYISTISGISKILRVKNISSFTNLVSQIKDIVKNNLVVRKNIIENFEDKLLEQLTIAPHTFKEPTLKQNILKAFEEDYKVKINAYTFFIRELTGKNDISDFKNKYETWKKKSIQTLLKNNGHWKEQEIE